jgi:hypothetical protein
MRSHIFLTEIKSMEVKSIEVELPQITIIIYDRKL